MSYISPPPHHDIYSIEDLAQLIADLRAINPAARIGVKLVATRGVGTIAAGVAKAGATYVQLSGHSGGTGASPLSSIKHVGAPWELGLAEVHQTLLRNGLRDRVALRTDGGLRTGRDLLVAALLGAEEFAFGTSMLVALGCDMARQCHLDTCPTGIATQREDLRAKFTGTPEHGRALLRSRSPRTSAASSRRSAPGRSARSSARAVDCLRRSAGRRAHAGPRCRSSAPAPWARFGAAPCHAGPRRARRPAAAGVAAREEPRRPRSAARPGSRPAGCGSRPPTARSVRRCPARWSAASSAARSGSSCAARPGSRSVHSPGPALDLRLVGQANDYVGKGLSGGRVAVVPEPDLAADAARQAIAGNTCLYGATGGRLHLVGRAGMRFAVRNSGAEAVVEGLGQHGCEYMTGGVVVVLGPIGANFGAGMTGGRAYLYDPDGRHVAALDARSVSATRLSAAARDREDGPARIDEFRALVEDHRDAGSALAARLLAERHELESDVWLVEPVAAPVAPAPLPVRASAARARPTAAVAGADAATISAWASSRSS